MYLSILGVTMALSYGLLHRVTGTRDEELALLFLIDSSKVCDVSYQILMYDSWGTPIDIMFVINIALPFCGVLYMLRGLFISTFVWS